jgi:branched-chain amino acid aminotransferase
MSLLPMDERDGAIWLDGALLPWRDARIHVLSHGLHYASAVFEGERVYGGRVFQLAAHGRRLLRSCAIMDMECPYGAAALDQAALAVVEANGIADGYLRRIAWRGAEQLGVAARATRIHVAIAAWPWPRYFAGAAEGRRPPPECAPVLAKAGCLYAIGTLAKHAAERAGCDDALLLDWRGRVAEATGANVFFLQGDVLHTPIPDAFLDGITRQSVIGLARARGREVVERVIMPDELAGFEACFLTGSAAEVAPVQQIGPHRFAPSPVVRQLVEDYAALVRQPAASEALPAA